MMMTKQPSEKEEQPAAIAAPAPAALNVGSVADLERRLAEMGTPKKATPPAAPVPAAPPTYSATAAPAQAPAVVKGGKNALLARIMAAKEKQQKKATPPPQAPPPSIDMLTDFDAPPSITNLPPPSYETNFLKDAPPPAFDIMEQQQMQPPPQMQQMQMQFPPPPPIDSVLPPPLNDVLPPPSMPSMGGDLFDMGMPSAPMFEDLHMQQQQHPPPMPPPMEAAPPALDIDESILNALEPAEREAFLEEQLKILEQIEREKSNNEASGAAARAMAFDQRSSTAVADIAASYVRGDRSRSRPSSSSGGGNGTMVNLGSSSGSAGIRGPEETQKAIDDGTAVIVKCMSCNNWMQVAEAAELMFCPICQVVCPVEKKGAATTADMGAAAQLAADAELAEKLQKEEYAGAEQRGSRTSGRSSRAQSSAAASTSDGNTSSSWYGWLTGAPAPATAEPPATRPAQTSGVSSRSSPQRTGGGLVSAIADESVGLIGGSGGSGSSGARMADPSKSMFSCVADSMNTAVTQMYTFQSDEEGNVHGVDSEGLLAMPDVSRQRE